MVVYKKMRFLRHLETFLSCNRRKAIILLHVLFVFLAYSLAFGLRFELDIPAAQQRLLLKTLPFLLICRLSTYYIFNLNSGWWRFVGMMDLVNLTKAIFSGTVVFLLGMVFVYGMEGYPRSVIILEAILNFAFLGGGRFGVRWFRESGAQTTPKQIKYVLVVGAGKAGAQLLKEVRIKPQLGIRVVAFIDDNPKKVNARIHGVTVAGNCKAIPVLIKKHNIDELIITIPCAGYKKISSIVAMAEECGVPAKVLPSLAQIIHQDGLWQQLRDVPYDELIGRPIVSFRRESDLDMLETEIKGKSVLITGAGGSIGSELSRQCAKRKPRRLVLYERNETALYLLELELKSEFPDCPIVPLIGDILDKKKLTEVITRTGVNLIYHAAAYKHVPMMEREPWEAIRNNVTATRIVAEAAIANNVEKCVYISTDKAVNPSNIMGATKRLGELVMQAFSGKGTKFITVRFGNVIGSNGSVIPLFKDQIARGGPVTVTHPDTTRFFMSISEAVQLVMTAGATGRGSEIFLLDMGEPMNIADLAKRLIKSSGLVPGEDIEIKYIGLRPGEKMHEELYWKGDSVLPTKNKKITKLLLNGLERNAIISKIATLERVQHGPHADKVVAMLKMIVPESTIGQNGRNGATHSSGPTDSAKQREPNGDMPANQKLQKTEDMYGWQFSVGQISG